MQRRCSLPHDWPLRARLSASAIRRVRQAFRGEDVPKVHQRGSRLPGSRLLFDRFSRVNGGAPTCDGNGARGVVLLAERAAKGACCKGPTENIVSGTLLRHKRDVL